MGLTDIGAVVLGAVFAAKHMQHSCNHTCAQLVHRVHRVAAAAVGTLGHAGQTHRLMGSIYINKTSVTIDTV